MLRILSRVLNAKTAAALVCAAALGSPGTLLAHGGGHGGGGGGHMGGSHMGGGGYSGGHHYGGYGGGGYRSFGGYGLGGYGLGGYGFGGYGLGGYGGYGGYGNRYYSGYGYNSPLYYNRSYSSGYAPNYYSNGSNTAVYTTPTPTTNRYQGGFNERGEATGEVRPGMIMPDGAIVTSVK